MTRFVADLHPANHRQFGGETRAGLNDRARAILGAYQRANPDIVLGDVFDNPYPSPALMDGLCAASDGVDTGTTILAAGNHDTAQCGVDAVRLLRWTRLFEVVCDVPIKHDPGGPYNVPVTLIPFQTKSIRDELAERTDCAPVLGFHAGIYDDTFPPWLRDRTGAIDVALLRYECVRLGIKVVVAGDWHRHKRWDFPEVTIVQVGTLCPTGFDDDGFNGVGTVVDVTRDAGTRDTFNVAVFPVAGPRFGTIKNEQDAIELAEHLKPIGPYSVYLRVLAPRAQHGLIARALADVPQVRGLTYVDSDAAQTRHSIAQLTAGWTDQRFDELVHGYVEKLTLPGHVDRADVLSRTNKLLADAGDR